MREICLDTETTGLDPRDGHKIIEIACVELVNKVKTGNHFHAYINPRREVGVEAFKIHGISNDFLADKPIFAHIADKFLDFIANSKLIIHNAAFDMKFINFELGLIGRGPIYSDNVVDSLILARKKFPGAQNSLDALCKRFGVDLSKRIKHGALLDSELLADVYIELMGGSQVNLGLEIVKNNIDSLQEVKEKKIIKSRNFELSEKEMEDHKDFIKKNIKNNIWQF